MRVATFNLENLGSETAGGATLQARIRVLRPQLLRLRADILCLQEVDGQRTAGSGRRDLDALDALIEGTPYAAFHRASTVSRRTGEVRDKHNIVTLSRFPFAEVSQLFHGMVRPPVLKLGTRGEGDGPTMTVEWDRPLLHTVIPLAPSRGLHLINVHLRAPRAAYIPEAKADKRTWRTMKAWAEGFYIAAIKRGGQALEARFLIDQVFDGEAEALILILGDFNADIDDTPLRIIRGDEEDAGNPDLAFRTLVPLDRSLSLSRRYSVIHHGRPRMPDHLLASRSLLAGFRFLEVHNEALGDELLTPHAVPGAPQSFHAPLVAEFDLGVHGPAVADRT